MKRLGFWKKDEAKSILPESLIEKEAALTKELRDLLEKQHRFQNKEQALIEVRRTRLETSKKKREENKLLRKQQKEQKAARWKERKEKEILYLGEDVSGGLNNNSSNAESLNKQKLPVIANAEELARAMNTTVAELRFLAYHRIVSKTTHYQRFYIPKKTGGKRLISTPMPRLKTAQHWVLENILEIPEVKDTAHGFVKKRSIVSNAVPHLKAEVVINIDLKDFFPSIDYKRVKGLFISLGYSEQVAIILSLLCTEPESDQIELDGQKYYVAGTERFLPQGAPTSPAVTNLICRKLDARLIGISKKLGFTYTRYADDLTFSASGEAVKSVKTLMGFIRKIVKDEDLNIHPDKIRVLRKGSRKEVTGIVVNDKPGINAKELDRFRALLFQIEKDGIEGKHWKNSPHLLPSIKGYVNFVSMVDAEKGKALKVRVDAILQKYGYKHEIRHKSKEQVAKEQARIEAEAVVQKKKPWWKFW
jgi:RNA-directed DNA polymerase